ncbi:hypothetical protein H6768_00640 [Candidatus Peribacteria bacterium]|nr:hypothetical protein [Candidatus Peribacteria bacterium]
MTGYIRILYPTKQCNSCSIEAESRGVLTPALQKCYAEVAEAGAHIARFFNAENRDRTRMIRRERAMTKEIQTGAEAYDKLLDKGQARLVLFGTYQQSH